MKNISDYVRNDGQPDFWRYWQDVSNDLDVDINTLICGYARQPINIGLVGEAFMVQSTCALEGRHCSHYVKPQERFYVTECLVYVDYFAQHKEVKKRGKR